MVNETTKSNNSAVIDALNAGGTASTATRKKDELGKDEFLKLLVTQLQQQDPLDPMKSDQFAVNLAQFSQLEQLMSINGKLGVQDTAGADMNSLTGYLGHMVVLNDETVSVKDGNGGLVHVDLDVDASALTLELTDKDGTVVSSSEMGALKSGEHTLSLEGLSVAAGEYNLKVTSKGTSGAGVPVKASVAGLVTGVVPGAEPKLIVDGQEVSLTDVKQVTLAPQANAS